MTELDVYLIMSTLFLIGLSGIIVKSRSHHNKKLYKTVDYPFRPMDNRERRALWASRYYLNHRPLSNSFFINNTKNQ